MLPGFSASSSLYRSPQMYAGYSTSSVGDAARWAGLGGLSLPRTAPLRILAPRMDVPNAYRGVTVTTAATSSRTPLRTCATTAVAVRKVKHAVFHTRIMDPVSQAAWTLGQTFITAAVALRHVTPGRYAATVTAPRRTMGPAAVPPSHVLRAWIAAGVSAWI